MLKQSLGLAALLASACTLPFSNNQAPQAEEGGANANDRTFGGEQGQELLTGAMSVSPSGKYAVMQRNTLSVLYDFQTKKYENLPFRVVRVAWGNDVAIFSQSDGSIASYDLALRKTQWVQKSASPSLLHIAGDAVVAAANGNVNVFDAKTGAPRGGSILGSAARFATEVPGKNALLVVGDTSWVDHQPKTPILRIDLSKGAGDRIDIPNCSAPIQVLPDGARAFLSPTFCEEGVQSTANGQSWTNPDPVSVIELEPFKFNKNLPGFGPVAMREDGSLAVAYLDTKRMDPSMFEDKSQIPSAGAPEYHLMLINPKTLAFTLSPIGDALPRFALTRDGKGLLVDASVKVATRVKISAMGSLSIGADGISGKLSVDARIFGNDSAFGYFDLGSKSFVPFTGVRAGIDRFVQLADGKTVIALEKRKDGLGGIPHKIDLETKTVTTLAEPKGSSGVRDIGLLADGKTIVVRVRMPAATISGKLYSQEATYLSFDFSAQIDGSFTLYTDPNSFANVDPEGCPTGYHDCW